MSDGWYFLATVSAIVAAACLLILIVMAFEGGTDTTVTITCDKGQILHATKDSIICTPRR